MEYIYNIGLHVFRRTNENELGTYINTCTIIHKTLHVNIELYIYINNIYI